MPPVWSWLQSLGNVELRQFPVAVADRQFIVDQEDLAEYRHQVLTPIQSRVYTGAYRAVTDARTRNPLHLIRKLEMGQKCFVALGAVGSKDPNPRPERINMVELKHIKYDDKEKRFRYIAQFYRTKTGVEFDFSKNFGPAYRPEAVLAHWPDKSKIPPQYLIPGDLPFKYVRKEWPIKNNDPSFRYVDDVREVSVESLIVNEFVPTASNGISERFKRRILDALTELQSAWDQGVRKSAIVHPEPPVESAPVTAQPKRRKPAARKPAPKPATKPGPIADSRKRRHE